MSSEDWRKDCQKWRGRLLTGKFAHWCGDWDDLPVDETTPKEFSCCTCELENIDNCELDAAREQARMEEENESNN